MTMSCWRSGYGVLLSLSVLGLAAGGCSKKSEDAPKKAMPAATAKPAIPGIDNDMMASLEAIKTNCDVDTATSQVSSCKQQETRQLAATFARNGNDRVRVLPTVAHALASSDEKLATVAATILYASFRSSFGEAKAGDVSPETALKMINAVPKLGKSQAAQAIAAVVHAAMLAGQSEALFKMLDKSEDASLPSVAYRHLLTYGGVAALPKIAELTKGPGVAAAVSALESVRSAESLEENRQVLCDFAKEVTKDPRMPVSAKAGSILVRCGGEYIDALLADSEARLKAGTFSAAHARSLRDVCGVDPSAPKALGTEKQCEQNRRLLRGALLNEEVENTTKADVMVALVEQWPDDETAKLLTKFRKDKDPRLVNRAEDALGRLERLRRIREGATEGTTPTGSSTAAP